MVERAAPLRGWSFSRQPRALGTPVALSRQEEGRQFDTEKHIRAEKISAGGHAAAADAVTQAPGDQTSIRKGRCLE